MTGIVTDATAIQFRMLNRSKGPAMWSPRAQCDRAKFITTWRHHLDHTDNLDIWQDEACEVLAENGIVCGVRTLWGVTIHARAVVVTAGTFLNGLMHVGRKQVKGGRCAEPASTFLTQSLEQFGITHERMKTGTPVRIDARSVHYEDMETQPGRERLSPLFLYQRITPPAPTALLDLQHECRGARGVATRIARFTTLQRPNQSIGPRYCPSIETKIVTFAERDQHPLFLEPEGIDTNELYLNGFSSSLPLNINWKR